MGTYSTNQLNGVQLTDTAQNPVVIDAGVTIGDSGVLSAIGASSTTLQFTIDNSGIVRTTSKHSNGEYRNSHIGVLLNGGGSVTNEAGGYIFGTFNGVTLRKLGTLSNDGTIASANVLGGTYGNIVPTAAGVSMVGGTLLNGTGFGSTALIAGSEYGANVGTSFGGMRVDNFGSIINLSNTFNPGDYNGGGYGGGFGLITHNGVTIVNEAGGLIFGHRVGIGVFGGGALVNSGGITASLGGTIAGGTAIRLQDGGYINNDSTGVISGVDVGVYGYHNVGGTITNSGQITATGTAGTGVMLTADGSTLTTSGTVTGASAAVWFTGATNLLGLQNGYKFIGSVIGGAAADTLALLGSVGNNLMVDYNGLLLTNFDDVVFGADGGNTLKVSNDTGTLPIMISGFTLTTDVIDLTAVGIDAVENIDTANNLVTISGSSGSVTLKFDASDSTDLTITSDGTSGVLLSVACYCRGTLICTDRGEVAIEDLRIGNRVVTLAGECRPVRWIGRRAYSGQFIAGNRTVLPVCITAAALAEGVPARDLWVSPEHALYLDGVLVAANLLVNGETIKQVESLPMLEYFHIELEEHDILLAEGAPAESYAESDNRGMFQNAREFAVLYPDDAPSFRYCAPRLAEGAPELAAIMARLTRVADKRMAG